MAVTSNCVNEKKFFQLESGECQESQYGSYRYKQGRGGPGGGGGGVWGGHAYLLKARTPSHLKIIVLKFCLYKLLINRAKKFSQAPI